MGCKPFSKRLKTSFLHAIYVGGLTFFSTLSGEFVDRALTGENVIFCAISSFIAFGLAFFASYGVQTKNGTYVPSPPQPPQKKKTIKVSSTNTLKESKDSDPCDNHCVSKRWKSLLHIVHANSRNNWEGCDKI